MDSWTEVVLLVFIASGATLGWHSHVTQPVQVHLTCWEDPEYLNYTEYGNHSVVRLDTHTPRWRALLYQETVQGPTQVSVTDGENGNQPKRMVMPTQPMPVEEAAYFYGDPKYTRHFECERDFL